MIELWCQYLDIRRILQYGLIMTRTIFRVNLHSIVCLNVNKLLTGSKCHIWVLSDSNEIRNHNHLVRKWTLNHFVQLAKWLSCVLCTYPVGAFDCIFLSLHVQLSELIHTLSFAWMSRKSSLEAKAISEV